MKTVIILWLIFLTPSFVWGQKMGNKKSTVMFFSKTPIEDIDATCMVVNSIFNVATGDIFFSIELKDFEFKKLLMKKHFNEKYLETAKYPNATFQGKLMGFDADKEGKQVVHSIGKLTMHGVTKQIEVPGTVEFNKGKVFATSKFQVALTDYNIMAPQLLWQKVAEIINITVDFTYEAL